jgi:hypothetical protein
LPALLDAAPGDASLDALRAHVVACGACQTVYSRLEALETVLVDAGASLRDSLPSVDLLDAVLTGVDDLKSGRRFLEDEEDPLSIDFLYALEREQDDLRRARFEKTLRQHPSLQQEYNDLQALHENLQASAQDDLPEIDLVASVMARLPERKAQEAAQGFTEQVRADLNAFMEDTLDAEGLERLERAAGLREESGFNGPSGDWRSQGGFSAVREEFERRRTLKRDLEQVGEALRARLPQVNLVEPVMAAVKAAAPMVAFRARPKPVQTAPARVRRFSFPYAAGFAAAAVLMVGVGILLFRASEAVNHPSEIAAKVEQTTPAVKPPAPLRHVPASQSEHLAAVRPTPVSPLMPPAPSTPSAPQPAKQPKPKGLTLQDAINARKLAMLDDADSLSKLAQWASLTPDEARDLLKQSGLSSEAVIGATQFLPANEAAAVLRAAMANNPDDPYLNYALAKAYGSDPDHAADSTAALAAWSAKDQTNSMPQFMLARAEFAQGNNEAALDTLTQASAQTTANDYAVRSASQQKEALIASGMDADTATYLAATLAGNQQYESLTQMGRDLIQQGKYYESVGDMDTAQQIYQSVQQMGAQLVTGASLSTEKLAGYQIQLDAVDAFKQIYTVLAQPDSIQLLEGAYQGIKEGVSQTLDFVSDLGAYLLALPSASAVNIAGQILQGGDLGVNTHSTSTAH